MKRHNFSAFRQLKTIDEIVEYLDNFIENELEYDQPVELDQLSTKIRKQILIVDYFMAIIDADKYREQGWYLLFNEDWTKFKKIEYLTK